MHSIRKNYKIKFVEQSELDEIYSFNKQVFPTKHSSGRILKFWFSKHPEEITFCVILRGESEEIWGQSLYSTTTYFYNEQLLKGEWFYDFIIREDKRRLGFSSALINFVSRHINIPIFAVGAGPVSLKIQKSTGFKFLGELKKYIGIIKPLYLTTSLMRGNIPRKRFPESISIKEASYSLIDKEIEFDQKYAFNKNLIEFGRDNAFIKWRYFSGLHEYAFYKKDQSDDFFVLRTIVKKKITCLVLVDYRCNTSDQTGFVSIMKAIKKIARKVHLGILITGSSLKCIDIILEKNYFRAIGRHRPIMATGLLDIDSDKISDRSYIFLTLGDSDGEIVW